MWPASSVASSTTTRRSRRRSGRSSATTGPPWHRLAGQTQKLHADATRVQQTTEAMERLRHTVVGYDKARRRRHVHRERTGCGRDRSWLEPKLPCHFDPKGQPPPFTLRGDEGFGTDTWADLNVRYTELEKSLLEFATGHSHGVRPHAAGPARRGHRAQPRGHAEQDWLRSKAGNALDETLWSIHAEPAARLDEDDIQFGTPSSPSTSSSSPARWVGRSGSSPCPSG